MSSTNLKRNRVQKPVYQLIRSLARDQQLFPYRVNIPIEPPQRQANPVVERTVRLLIPDATAFNISGKSVSSQDGTDYLGSVAPRYKTVTITGIKVWRGDIGSQSLMQLIHNPTGFKSIDAGTTGAKRAGIALRLPPSIQKSTLTTDTTVIFSVLGGAEVPGNGYADVVVRFA